MAKVLVIGDDMRSFLAVVRSLGKAGHSLHILPEHQSSPALRSRYIQRCHNLVPAFVDAAAWCQALAALDKKEQFDWILPCTDQALLPLIQLDHGIDPQKILSPGGAAFDAFSDKIKTHALADAVGVPMARWSPIGDGDLSFPCYLKPRRSVTLDHLGGKHKVRRLDQASDLKALLVQDPPFQQADYFLEEAFDGYGCGLSVLATKGVVTAAFQHQRLSEGVAGGSSLRRSVALDARLLQAAQKLATASELDGLAMMEFRLSSDAAHFILLEVNARVWGSLPLAIQAGVDFPRLLLAAKQMDVPAPQESVLPPYKVGAVARALTPSLYDFQRRLAGLPAGRQLLTVIGASVKASLSLMMGQQKIDTFDWHDRAPFWGELGQVVRTFVSKIGRVTGIGPWLLGARAASKLSRWQGKKATLLILCYGNICRSPFLEKGLRDRLSGHDLTIESAGFHAQQGRRSPDYAVKAAETEGYDLSGHRSQFASAAMIEAADVIFYFDDMNLQALKDFYPDAAHKALPVGAFTVSKADVEDPYGGTLKDYLHCYQRIGMAAENIADSLLGPKGTGDKND